MIVLVLLALIAVGFVLFKVWRDHKTPKVGSLALVTGGVKTGKTTFAVRLAHVNHRRAVRRYYITSFFSFLKPSWRNQEKPLLYSNIPLSEPYVPVTPEMLRREVRFRYKSTILLSEASLVADSQLVKDLALNDDILLFCKLIAHETRGGMLVLDTQCIGDLHYGFKRCLSEYFYIHHIFKWIPGFIIAWIQENRYSDDGSVVTAETGDVEDNLKWLLIPKKTWKLFDCYTYSLMTDGLDVVANSRVSDRKHLKTSNIISFRDRDFFKKKKKGSATLSRSGVKDRSECAAPVLTVIPFEVNDEKKDN